MPPVENSLVVKLDVSQLLFVRQRSDFEHKIQFSFGVEPTIWVFDGEKQLFAFGESGTTNDLGFGQSVGAEIADFLASSVDRVGVALVIGTLNHKRRE